MAPRENIRGMTLAEQVSDPGLDLTLSLSVGGTGRKRAAELEPVQEHGAHVAKHRNYGVKREVGIEGGGTGTGFSNWFPSKYLYHAHLEKSVSIGTSMGRSTSVISDKGSRCVIGGFSSNSDSTTTTTTTTTTSAAQNTGGGITNGNNNIIFPRMPHMPCVTVRGNGPGAPAVTGFLYRVTTTAEVFIVCACHGMFFSPTGFVEHAGWTNVTNPLKLIVVKPY